MLVCLTGLLYIHVYSMVLNMTGTVTWGDIQGFSTVFLYNEIEAIFGHTTTTRIGQLFIDV